jgi:putative phage-type endonuclease
MAKTKVAEPFEIVGVASDREQWLADRREGIGGSDLPAIMGLVSWSDPLKVFSDKLGLIPDEEEKEHQKWGKLLEPLILQEFARETLRQVQHTNALCVSREASWMRCTLDGTQKHNWLETAAGTDEVGNVECKATNRYGRWDEGIPMAELVQVQWQLGITGRQHASVAVLQNGIKLVWGDVAFDPEMFKQLTAVAEEFWFKHVVAVEPPEPTASDASKLALKSLYPKDDGSEVILSDEYLDDDERLVELKRHQKEVKQAIDEHENRLRAAIGNATYGLLQNGVSYSNKWQARKEHFVKASEFRVLRRKGE